MTVFVVQQQFKKDPETGELVNKFDLRAAREFGQTEYLLSPSAHPFNPEPIVAELRQKLARYNPIADYLLLLGNPMLIGFTVAIAAEITGGPVSLLQWSGKDRAYIAVSADLFDK